MTTRLAILPAVARDIIHHVDDIVDHLASKGVTAPLYRVFYYTADPPSGKRINPMNKTDTPLSDPTVSGKTRQLHRDLEREPYVAVRRGDVAFQGWRIKRSVARSLMEGKPRPLAAEDIRPSLSGQSLQSGRRGTPDPFRLRLPGAQRIVKLPKYKGYVAAVEFDDSSNVLHGRVINSGPYPIATFEATDTSQLRREFHRSIDEYLAWCEEDAAEPRISFGGRFSS